MTRHLVAYKQKHTGETPVPLFRLKHTDAQRWQEEYCGMSVAVVFRWLGMNGSAIA